MLVLERLLPLLMFGTALISLSFVTLRLRGNLRFLARTQQRVTQPVAQQRVSVLVPARDEATTITACITSLLRQDYTDYEVIVLDDASTDGTGAQLDALAARHPELTVLHSSVDIPPGWNGKSYACHRLAQAATGAWLLFTDADTVHSPRSIASVMAQATALNVSFVSAFPYQRTITWSERILVSFIIDFLPLIGVDFAALWRGDGSATAANGQYLLVSAARYREVGGHASIHAAMVDDFALARRFQTCGDAIGLIDGSAMLSCRMYHSLHEVWAGFSKNLLFGLESTSLASTRSRAWLAPLFAWCYFCVFVLPFLALAVRWQLWPAGATIAWLALLRGATSRHLHRSSLEILTTPLAAWSVMALGLYALYLRWRKRSIRWKGRVYDSKPSQRLSQEESISHQ